MYKIRIQTIKMFSRVRKELCKATIREAQASIDKTLERNAKALHIQQGF